MDSWPTKPVDGFAAFSVERLASLSDGVFAVAMTLLAYNIHIPIGPLNEAGLRGALARMVPAVMALVLSFFAAVMFWMGHQRLLGMMRQSGGTIYPPSFICSCSSSCCRLRPTSTERLERRPQLLCSTASTLQV